MDFAYDFPLQDIPQSANLSIYAASAEENNKPPLLLIHGFLSSRAQWLGNLSGMKNFCRPIVIEHFGHGRTPAPQEESKCSFEALIVQIERLRVFLGINQWSVCGHSMGGTIGLTYAIRHPDVVKSVVFSNVATAFLDPQKVDMTAEVKEVASSVEDGGRIRLEETPFHPIRMKRVAPEIQNALVSDAKLIDPVGVARAVRATSVNVSIRHRMPEILCPTLLINGILERGFQADRRWAEDIFSSLSIVDLANAGHNPNAEMPIEFNSAVEEFLKSNGC